MFKNPIEEQLVELRSARDTALSAAMELISSDDYNADAPEIRTLEERAEGLTAQIERLSKLVEAQTASDALDGRLAKAQKRSVEVREARESGTLGSAFVASEQFRSYRGRGTSERFEWAGDQERALPHTLASFSDVLALGANPVVDVTPGKPSFKFLPLLTSVPVSGNVVDTVTWSKAAGAAGVVAEGAEKPAVEWTAETDSFSLATIAATTEFSRQLAADSAAVRSYLDQQLRYEVMAKLEAEAEATITGAFDTIDAVDAPTDSGVVGAVRRGKSYLKNTYGLAANGFFIRESDLIELDIAMSAQTNSAPGEYNYWGLKPIEVDDADLDAGTVVVADLRQGAQHFSRTGLETYITDSHADYFKKNLLVALAEARAKTVITRPFAFVLAGEAVVGS